MNKRRGRSAYTLMELLLVMAIIVIVAAAATPSFRGAMRNSALSSGASDVRAALVRTHVMAMKTGRIHAFQYEQDGMKYKIEPWIGGDDSLESKEGTSGAFAVAPTGVENSEQTLPEQTRFVLGDAMQQSRGQQVEEEMMSLGGAGATWSRPILFFPDGTATDAFIVIGNDFERGIRIDLRGLTSAVTVSQLSDLEQLEQEAAVSP
jgi:prepilin-type N-terminal cleavage/methylation domain-containing protein